MNSVPSTGRIVAKRIMAKRIIVSLALAMGLAGAVAKSAQAAELGLADFTGVWQMRGYGKVYDISSQRAVVYDVTDVSCVREDEAPLAKAADIYEKFTRTTNGFTAFAAGGITSYAFERLAALPERCRTAGEQPLTDPELNFWALWHAFQENYAFFNLREVKWNDIYSQFRPKISSATTQDQLFEVLSEVLKALNDGHVGLQAGERHFSSGGHGELADAWTAEQAPNTGRASDADLGKLFERFKSTAQSFVVDEVLHGKASKGANDLLIWGWAAPGVGYLYVDQMYMEPRQEGQEPLPLPQQIQLIDAAMVRVLNDLRSAKALLVDARFNPGGHDAIALRIAGYLTKERRVAFTKKAVLGAGFTDVQEIHIDPQGKRQFTGPIYYLQSGNTVSAAEIFSLAMMALPNVTRVGTPTYGVLSDVLGKKLPNGWQLGLSNELYVAVDGNLYEGRGIPPTVPVAVASAKNFHQRMQLDVDTALTLIKKTASAAH